MSNALSANKRIARLERLCSDRYRDIAIRTRIKTTGEFGPLHGGRWDLHEGRYLEPWELRYHALSATTEEESERARLVVVTRDVYPAQFELIEDMTTPLIMANGTRRAGKSQSSAIKAAVCGASRPNMDGQIASPTYPKSRIMWDYVHQTIPVDWIEQERIDEHWLRLWTGVRIGFVSTHDSDTVIGDGVGWLAFDEFQSITERAWSRALPTLSEGGRQFQLWGCGTPRMGTYRQRWQRFRALEADGQAKVLRLSWRDNVFLDSGERTIFDLAPHVIDARTRIQDLEGEFTSDEGLVYYQFDRVVHGRNWRMLQRRERPWAEDITERFLHRELEVVLLGRMGAKYLIGVDYGINCQFAVIYKVVLVEGYESLWAVGEVFMDRDASPEKLAAALIAGGYWPAAICDDATGLKCMGDGHAGHKLEAARVRGEPGPVFECFHRRQNRPAQVRVASLNALMKNAVGQVRWYVDLDACPRLVEALENQEMWKGQPRRSRREEPNYHDMPPAAGYPVVYLFPADVEYEVAA